jgi:hypothetical protein
MSGGTDGVGGKDTAPTQQSQSEEDFSAYEEALGN